MQFLEWFKLTSKWIQANLGINPDIQILVLKICLFLLFLILTRRIILYFALRKNRNATSRYQWNRFSKYIFYAVAFLVISRWLFSGMGDILSYLGLLSAALAIALQDLLKNLAGWIFIIWRRPFKLGDRIEIGTNSGDVIDIRIFQFTVLEIGNWVAADQSTGRIIHIPNGKVFTESLSNFYSGVQFIWSELTVTLTFESDWKLAKNILSKIAEKNARHLSPAAEKRVYEVSRDYMIHYNKLTPIVYTTVADSGVSLTLRYLTEPRKRRASDQEMWEDILDAFAKDTSIDFAYPTVRYFNHLTEGKQANGES